RLPESRAWRGPRRPLVQIMRLSPPALEIPVGGLQAQAEVLLPLACEPLNLPDDGRLIALDVSHFEETLVNPRPVEALLPQFLRYLSGLCKTIQADVGVQLTTI